MTDDKVTNIPPDRAADQRAAGGWTKGAVRKGSRLAYWRPIGLLEGILETNPDFPPRVHFFDGRGTVELVPVKVPVIRPLDPFSVNSHEHPPIIPGQEYPRDVSPIVDRTVTETKWMLPEKKTPTR